MTEVSKALSQEPTCQELSLPAGRCCLVILLALEDKLDDVRDWCKISRYCSTGHEEEIAPGAASYLKSYLFSSSIYTHTSVYLWVSLAALL